MELENKLTYLSKISNDINDPKIKQAFIILLNIVEELYSENKRLKQENQELKDEINRLKGEKGKPSIPPNNKKSKNISSEKERKRDKKWQKKAKKGNLKIDHEYHCEIDKNSLPPDAIYKYTDTVIGQDLVLKRKNTLYLVDVYYSPSEKKTYRSPLPEEYKGYHGNGIRSLALTLHNVCDVPSDKILNLLQSTGVEISKGSLSRILLGNSEWIFAEKNSILNAGLEVSYAQIDATGSRVCGENYFTQIIGNDFFTFYATMKNKSRLDVLASFQGLADKKQLCLKYTDETKQLLKKLKVSKKDIKLLEENFHPGFIESLEKFEELIRNKIPRLYKKPKIFIKVKEAFALSYYHCQGEYPLVELLISDDAPEYNQIATLYHGLCWVHDGRYYKKLTPIVKTHKETVLDFMNKYWGYYHRLLEYKKSPSEELAKTLNLEFDELFVANTDYFQLNQCIKRTLANKEQLLGVLKYPHLPLHNNAAELGARKKARKRDISFHTMTKVGTMVQDAWMTIVQTAIKLGVDIYEYIYTNIEKNKNSISLADIIYQKANYNTT